MFRNRQPVSFVISNARQEAEDFPAASQKESDQQALLLFSLPKKNRPIFLAAPSFFASLPPTSPRGKVPPFSLRNMGRDEEPPPPRTHQPSASTPVLGAPPRPAPPPPRPPTSVHPQPHPQPPPLPPCSLIVAALQSTPPPPPPLSTSGVSRPPPPHITGEET